MQERVIYAKAVDILLINVLKRNKTKIDVSAYICTITVIYGKTHRLNNKKPLIGESRNEGLNLV